MDGRDSVRAMRTRDGEIGHPHLPFRAFLDETHTLYPSFIAGKSRSHVIEQPAIDLVDDLEMTRQQDLEPFDRPFLQSFGQQRVIGVRQCFNCNGPSVVPTEMDLVEQNPHQLRYCHRRMRVIELDGDFVGQRVPVGVGCAKTAHEIRERARNQKIFLDETQPLPHGCVVVGVEHPCQRFGPEGFRQCADEITAAEFLEVEVILRRRGPEPQRIDRLAAVADYGTIERNTDEP